MEASAVNSQLACRADKQILVSLENSVSRALAPARYSAVSTYSTKMYYKKLHVVLFCRPSQAAIGLIGSAKRRQTQLTEV